MRKNKDTNENQPLKYLWSPVIEPKRKNGNYDFQNKSDVVK